MTDLREIAMQNQIDSLAAENRDLSAVNKDLSSEVQRLKEQNAFLRKNLFGRKSEKTKVVFDGQINLFDEAEQEAKKSAPEPELQTVQEHTRKKKETIVMPAGHPHAVYGVEDFKMMLVVAFPAE